MPEVKSTLRLQFHREFTLDTAIPLVPYFHQLGISHIYASPLLKARAGSMHGYDVIDPTCINPELGGEQALCRLVNELRKYDMGLIVDIVSNHMAVGDENPWWVDVLKWGLKSPYAQFFDIQWNSPDPLLKGQLLAPFLRAGYGEVLASGEIKLHFDDSEGSFYIKCGGHRFPIYPPSYAHILRNTGNDSLLALVHPFESLERLPDGWSAATHLHQQLSDAAKASDVKASIQKAIDYYDVNLSSENNSHQIIAENTIHKNENKDIHAGDLHPDWQNNATLQRLHQLLELQHYRLASWITAADDINWRRFFDVNELGGIRVERPEVFDATHVKIFDLIAKGLIDGLRIDHVDGLANPRAYCRKLRRYVDNLVAARPSHLEKTHFPIYVEKILADGESLSQDWHVDGTTGYEFMNQVSLLQHDPEGEQILTDLWKNISGRSGAFIDEVKEAKQLVLSSSLAGDVEMVAQGLLAIARTDIATRDLTLGAIRRTLIELVANFPVYRTYAVACGRSHQDQVFFDYAVKAASTTLSETDWPLLDYLDRWLGGQPLHSLPPVPIRKLRKKVIARFQQLTSPAAAKSVEDTACYRSAVLLSRNDVGFDPQHFSDDGIASFHQKNIERAKKFPFNLITTATHDHKRGEDTRARIAVISECAEWFSQKVQKWQQLAAPLRTHLEEGVAPSPGDELMLYQIILGSWPLSLDVNNEEELKFYLKRLIKWQEKAIREAKLRSNWSAPNTDYETACHNFLTRLFTNNETQTLRDDIVSAAMELAPAGALNSISQIILRMTVPGVPDLYQGADLWDFSLVDPDNRQPVDFAVRVSALSNATNHELIEQWRNGQIKQSLIRRMLGLRNNCPQLFMQGDYEPLTVEGQHAKHVIAFARHYEDKHLIVVVPRFGKRLLADSSTPIIAASTWGNTQVVLPSAMRNLRMENIFSPSLALASESHISLQDILIDFPIGILFLTT